MNRNNNLDFYEIRDNFIAGNYELNTDEYVTCGEILHNKLPSMEDLIPLLTSKNKPCQKMGVFIAALEGERACTIFNYIYNLIESPWVEVRDEVCDCFTSCGSRGEEFVTLLGLLKDPEECIRIKVIQVLMWLEYEKILMISDYLKTVHGLESLKIGVSLLLKQMKGEVVSYQDIENNILSKDKVVKVFSYITAFRYLGSNNRISSLVNLSNDTDILKHYEIYFS
ncbi:hypothetical protein VINI7043_21046 [Vibrio nigripulchritudo ATCC 27043]|uniref:hypothetical protein n=1 Tax=Vibrio nigripulchritudo TaxID=28173 RepID=UPI00021C1FB2|nr:hypothetical protein [Vibrio nigripulchritudo]EGU56397.1 hypothetical protein VINI7043_21046 [Vibrio nigripulchritudo ATCC 27043]